MSREGHRLAAVEPGRVTVQYDAITLTRMGRRAGWQCALEDGLDLAADLLEIAFSALFYVRHGGRGMREP